MPIILSISVGAVIGALSRYYLIGYIGRLFGSNFPWGTLIVNVVGSFIMGVLIELFALSWNASNEMRTFLTVGILGAFTTFSTFSLDVALLLQKGDMLNAALYIVGSVVLSVGGLFLGLYLMRAILN